MEEIMVILQSIEGRLMRLEAQVSNIAKKLPDAEFSAFNAESSHAKATHISRINKSTRDIKNDIKFDIESQIKAAREKALSKINQELK